MRPRLYLSIFMPVIVYVYSFGQTGYKFSLELPYSYSWAHHPYMNNLTGRTFTGLQVNLHFDRTRQVKDWIVAHNYPETGILFIYQNLQHPDLGKIIGSVYYFTFFLNKRSKKLNFLLQFGEGIAYNTNPYDKIENPKNIVFGSHLLYAFYFTAKLRYTFTGSPWEWETGFSMYHYSNGSYKTPNSGLNLPGFNIALLYNFNKTNNKIPQTNRNISFQKKRYREIYIRGTLSEMEVPGLGVKPGIIFGFKHVWHPAFKHQYYAGAELMLNYAYKSYLAYQHIAFNEYEKIPDFKRIAITGGYMFNLDPTNFILGTGIYLYNPSRKHLWYVRAGMSYRIASKWRLSATVKTHYFTAEEVDIGLHYIIN